MQKLMLTLALSLFAFSVQAQDVRIELAHKCFYNVNTTDNPGVACAKQSKQLKMLNKPGLPFEIHSACTEVTDLDTWQELGCPVGANGYFLEAFVMTPAMKMVQGQKFDLMETERSKVLNCTDFAATLQNYSTNEALISARCEKFTALKNKIITSIEFK